MSEDALSLHDDDFLTSFKGIDPLLYLYVITIACETQNAGVTSPKPCLSLSTPFTWDATSFSLLTSTTQTSDTDSDSGFDSHDVCHLLMTYILFH